MCQMPESGIQISFSRRNGKTPVSFLGYFKASGSNYSNICR